MGFKILFRTKKVEFIPMKSILPLIFSLLIVCCFDYLAAQPDGTSIGMSIVPMAKSSDPVFLTISNASNTTFSILAQRKNVLVAYDFRRNLLFEIKNQFDDAIQLASNAKTIYVLDSKEKLALGFDQGNGKLTHKIGTNAPDKIRKPIGISTLQNNQVLIMDAHKNTLHFFEAQGKHIKSIALNGTVSPVSMQCDGKENIYVLDDKLQAILRYDLDGKPTTTSRLYTDASSPNDRKGKIKSFILDPMGYLQVWNQVTNEIETYTWNDKPVKIFQSTPKEGLALSKAESIVILPTNYEIQISYHGNKISSFQYKIPVIKPENLFGFDVEGEKLLVSFKKLDPMQANRYGLMTQNVLGQDSLAYVSDGSPFVIEEKTIFQNRSRRYKLVAMNPSGKSEATSGFDNFYGFGNCLRKNDQFDEAITAYQNALRYMGRPAKMNHFVSLAILDIGKKMLTNNVDLLKGLNALKTAYNLNPKESSIQKGLTMGFDNLFWRLAAQENYNSIIVEAAKVINQTFLKNNILKSIDSLAITLEKLQAINTVSNARLLRAKLVDWAPERVTFWKGVHRVDLSLYQLKIKSGAPDYELQALIGEGERHIQKAIELLQKDGKPFIDESILYLQSLELSKKSAEQEKNARLLIQLHSNKMDVVQTMQVKELMASALVGQGQYDAALKEYNYLLTQKPNEVKWKLGLADAYFLAKNLPEALSLYKQLLLNDRDNYTYIAKIGLAELSLGNPNEASMQLEKAIELDPTNKSWAGPLGECYEYTNNVQKAIDQYKIAIVDYTQLNKNSASAAYAESSEKLKFYQNKLARLYLKINAFDKASELFQKLAQAQPLDASAWFGHGSASLSRGLVYDAVKSFQKARSLDPENVEYQTALQNSIDLRGQVSKNEDPIAIADVKIPEIYPSLYINYGDESLLPVGEVTLTNNTNLPVRYTQISIEIPEIMNEPTVLPGGVITSYSNSTINLSAIFSSKILVYLQSQKLQAKVVVSYTYDERPRIATKTAPVSIQSRNAINWTDKRRLASFIAVGPGPMAEYALSSNELFKGLVKSTLPENLTKALQLYTMLNQEKLIYTPDPDLSYSSVSTNTNLIDFLQYPGETLLKKRGDCDDMVTLYCSVLENAGIPTAFIDIPGHIFMAFDLNILPSQIEESGFNLRDVISLQGKVWLPIETTVIGKANFRDAWESAAQRYHLAINQGFFPELIKLADARKLYRPSSYNPTQQNGTFLVKETLIKEYTDESYRIYAKLNEGSLAALKNQYLYEPYNVFIKNRYAVTLGQAGRFAEAKEVLNDALKMAPTNSSVLNNLGNVYLQEGNISEAIKHYERSYRTDPSDLQTVHNLFKACLKENDKARAKIWLDIALSLDARSSEYLKNQLNQLK